MLRFARAAALAALLAVWPAAPALADSKLSAAAVSAEAELLAQEMVRLLFSEVDFTDIVQREMVRDTSKLFDDVPGRPEWPRLMRESMLEEADAMKPLMSRLLGKAFARYFTPEELRVGVAFLRGPAGPELAAMVAASAANKPSKPLSNTVMREMGKLAKTPAGRAWAEKFGDLDKVMDGATNDFVATIFLDVMRRFIAKAEAAEAQLAR
jgi:hypothetical protein